MWGNANRAADVAPAGVVPPRHWSLKGNHRPSISFALRASTDEAAWKSRTPWARTASTSAAEPFSGVVPAVAGGSAMLTVGAGAGTLGTVRSTAGPEAVLTTGIPPAAAGSTTTAAGATAVVVVAVVVDVVTAGTTVPTWVAGPPALTPTASMRVTVRVRPLPGR